MARRAGGAPEGARVAPRCDRFETQLPDVGQVGAVPLGSPSRRGAQEAGLLGGELEDGALLLHALKLGVDTGAVLQSAARTHPRPRSSLSLLPSPPLPPSAGGHTVLPLSLSSAPTPSLRQPFAMRLPHCATVLSPGARSLYRSICSRRGVLNLDASAGQTYSLQLDLGSYL